MTHLLLAAISGFGKSLQAQAWMEKNLPKFDHAAILDYKDEYRGLVKEGYASYLVVGEKEAELSVDAWKQFFRDNGRVVLKRNVGVDLWRQVADRIALALQELEGTGFFAFDEGRFIASQRKGTPENVLEIATTGRGEGVSSMVMVQRLQQLDEEYLSQCNEKLLGGFTSDKDRKKLEVEYPEEVHNPESRERIHDLPEELHADDGPVPVRRWTDEEGRTIGSEWIYSNDQGERKRIDTTGLPDQMETTHYGPEGEHLDMPEYA